MREETPNFVRIDNNIEHVTLRPKYVDTVYYRRGKQNHQLGSGFLGHFA
jgi:hypothetical protein